MLPRMKCHLCGVVVSKPSYEAAGPGSIPWSGCRLPVYPDAHHSYSCWSVNVETWRRLSVVTRISHWSYFPGQRVLTHHRLKLPLRQRWAPRPGAALRMLPTLPTYQMESNVDVFYYNPWIYNRLHMWVVEKGYCRKKCYVMRKKKNQISPLSSPVRRKSYGKISVLQFWCSIACSSAYFNRIESRANYFRFF